MKTLRFSLFILVLSLSMPTLAQIDLSDSYDFSSGIRLNFPNTWDILEADDGVHLRSEQTDLLFLFAPYQDESDVEAELENLFSTSRYDSSLSFIREDIFLGGLANFSLTASYFYQDNREGESIQRALFAIPVEEAVIVKVTVTPLASTEIDELSVVLRLLATLNYDESRVSTAPSNNPSSDAGLYRWASGVTMNYPEGYEVVEESLVTHFVSDEIDIGVYLYPVRDSRETNRPNTIRLSFSAVSEKTFDEENFVFLSLANDADALGYFYEELGDGDRFEQALIAFQPADIFIAVAVVLPRTSYSLEEIGGIEQVYEILGTMAFQ